MHVQECEKIGEGLSDMLGALFESGKDKSGRNIIEQPACLGSNELRLKPYQLVGMSWWVCFLPCFFPASGMDVALAICAIRAVSFPASCCNCCKPKQ